MHQHVRPATAADVTAISSVVVRAYEGYLSRMDQTPAPMTADYGALVEAGVVTVETDEDERIRGVLVAWVDGDSMYIDNLAVDPQAHGSGIGATLLAVAAERGTQAGCRRIWLYTNAAMTENIGYYQRRGFAQFDSRHHEGFDRIFFERDLPSRDGHDRTEVRDTSG